jgi:hypothetical protein
LSDIRRNLPKLKAPANILPAKRWEEPPQPRTTRERSDEENEEVR